MLQPDKAAQQEWQRHAATLSLDEFQAVFADGAYLQHLVLLTRHRDGALARLPLPLVRTHAQAIAGWLAQWSFITCPVLIAGNRNCAVPFGSPARHRLGMPGNRSSSLTVDGRVLGVENVSFLAPKLREPRLV